MKRISSLAVVTGVIILLLALSSCQNKNTTMENEELIPALTVLDAEMIASKDEICSTVVEGQITAWQSRDKEELERIYTDDIIHFDGGPAYVGIDEVLGMAGNMWLYFRDWEMRAGETYISDDICFGQWMNWSIFSFTEEEPGIEYDWLEFNDEGIHFWRLFYDEEFQAVFNHPERISNDFLTAFVNTWSAQETDAIGAIYGKDAQIEDSLFGLQLSGVDEIQAFAASFFTQFPNAEWRLVDSFGEEEAVRLRDEEYPFVYQGGIMEIEIPDSETGSCTIVLAVLLAPDEEGKILRQMMFYEPQSLINCGLAE